MTKRRKTPALFEVITGQRTQGQVQVPGWFGRLKAAPAAVRQTIRLKQPPGLEAPGPPAVTMTAVDEPPANEPATTSALATTVDWPAPGVTDQPACPAVGQHIAGIEAGRLKLNLGLPVCLAAALGLIVLLFAVYKLGAASGRSPGVPPSAPGGAVEQGPARSAGFDFAVELSRGQQRYTSEPCFIEVVRGVANQQDAEAICRYLHACGYDQLAVVDPQNVIYVIAWPNVPNAPIEMFRKQADVIQELGKHKDWPLRAKYDFSGARAVMK